MDKSFIKTKLIDILVFGILLWLMGYIASIILYLFVPNNLLGWILCIIFTPITFLIAHLRFKNRKQPMKYYIGVAVFWTLIAITFDYLFIVKLFNPVNYYKSDVFVYYIITFLIPIIISLSKRNKNNK
ncbi:MAG: hypothetical protein V1660_03050 [archaeon]